MLFDLSKYLILNAEFNWFLNLLTLDWLFVKMNMSLDKKIQ